MSNQLVMYEEELDKINAICERLNVDANAKAVLVIDKNGQANGRRCSGAQSMGAIC